MNAFAAIAHNYNLIKKAENIISDFIDNQSDNYKSYCYLVNPDGTKIRIQSGFRLESYELASFKK